MEDGKVVDRGSYKHIHNELGESDNSGFSDSIHTSQLSVREDEDIDLRFKRINSISPKRGNSVMSPLQRSDTKRNISTSRALSLAKQQSTIEYQPSEGYTDTVVRFEDWIKLYSFGIGN